MRLPKLPATAWILSVVVAAALVLGTATYYYYMQYRQAKRLLDNPQEAARIETQAVVGKLGKLMELPTGEEPTIATVLDAEKLKDQPFFTKAKNGDRVILYTNARRAILFRLSELKIIDVAPINIGTPSAGLQQAPPVRVALYNGTENVELTKKAERQLLDKYQDVAVVTRENATRRNYEKTIVVDRMGTKADAASTIAREFAGGVGKLPAGETATGSADADILVILGKSYQ